MTTINDNRTVEAQASGEVLKLPAAKPHAKTAHIAASTTPTTAISTNFNTNAAPSEFGLSIAEMAPIEGYDFRGLKWPEIDALDLRTNHNGKEVKLASYRWPAVEQRKGVIFMLHGYGSCAPQMAILAKFLAESGYEVFSFDMRGHGDSEGERGIFLSADQVYGDAWAMVFEACKKFKINQQRTPMFLYGRSFGGLLATNMANTTIGKAMFKGVVLLTPYYRLFTERLYEAYKMLVPLTMFQPNKLFYSEFAEIDEDYLAKYREIFEDKRNLAFFTATTARMWIEE